MPKTFPAATTIPHFRGSLDRQLRCTERKDQAEIRIPLERVIFDLQTQKFNAFKTISASGRLTRILYALPDGKTPEETEGYYENALRQANGEVLFSGVQDQLDNGDDRFVNQTYYGDLP